MVYVVGGWGNETTMEKKNIKDDSQWTMTTIPFGVRDYCLATTKTSVLIAGGFYNGVSQTILSFENRIHKR